MNEFFSNQKFDQVYLAAAKVGGIYANNTYPANFIYENLMIEANVIHAAHQSDIQKLLFFGSSCIYPRAAEQPLSETALLTGPLEPTNEPYAIAKIAGIKLCESFRRQYGRDYRSIMPSNLYGPGDNYDPTNSHVIPGLIHRFHTAKISNASEVTIWRTGSPRREFLYVDYLAVATIIIQTCSLEVYENLASAGGSFVNVGAREDITIFELADKIKKIVGFTGHIIFDKTKPDGTPRKVLNISRAKKPGWQASVPLEIGLETAYKDCLVQAKSGHQPK